MSTAQLKIIACLTMLIDHIGAVLFPEFLFLRVIGRISFPIFAFLIAEGYSRTKNVNKYLFRLFLFALISEIPFDLAFHKTLFYLGSQNVFFTLFLALLAMKIFDIYKESNRILGMLVVIFIAVIATILRTDYGIIGVLIIFGFYLYRGDFLKLSINLATYNFLMALAFLPQLFAVSALLFIFKYNGKKGSSLKFLFYIFYPGHLLVIALLDYVLK